MIERDGKLPDVEPEAAVVGIWTGTAGAIVGPGPIARCTTADAMVGSLPAGDQEGRNEGSPERSVGVGGGCRAPVKKKSKR